MVHPHDTPVADSTMMAAGRLVGVAPPTNRLGDSRLRCAYQRLGVPRDRSRIGEHGFELGYQRQTTKEDVYGYMCDRPPSIDSYDRHDDIRVQRQDPEHGRHHRARVVSFIAPVARALVRAAYGGIKIVHFLGVRGRHVGQHSSAWRRWARKLVARSVGARRRRPALESFSSLSRPARSAAAAPGLWKCTNTPFKLRQSSQWCAAAASK